MNDSRYKWILYIIVFVILGTISIQVYWNYKNYLVNKQQLVNDVQHSLDNAVEGYYAHLAEINTIAFAYDSNDSNFMEHGKLDSIMGTIEFSGKKLKSRDSIDIELFDGDSLYQSNDPNHVLKTLRDSQIQFPKTRLRSVFKGLHIDSSKHKFRSLTSK